MGLPSGAFVGKIVGFGIEPIFCGCLIQVGGSTPLAWMQPMHAAQLPDRLMISQAFGLMMSFDPFVSARLNACVFCDLSVVLKLA